MVPKCCTARKQVIHGKSSVQRETAVRSVTVQRKKQLDPSCEFRCALHPPAPLVQSLVYLSNVTLLEISQPTVQQLARRAARRAHQRATLEERDFVSAPPERPRAHHSVYSTTDDRNSHRVLRLHGACAPSSAAHCLDKEYSTNQSQARMDVAKKLRSTHAPVDEASRKNRKQYRR